MILRPNDHVLAIDAFPKGSESGQTMPKFKVAISRIEIHCPIGIKLLLGPFFSIKNFSFNLAIRKISENN